MKRKFIETIINDSENSIEKESPKNIESVGKYLPRTSSTESNSIIVNGIRIRRNSLSGTDNDDKNDIFNSDIKDTSKAQHKSFIEYYKSNNSSPELTR
jgi:ribosomal protein S16